MPYQTFSDRLTLQRKQKGVSQKQAAADLGISQALLSHYENGIREPGLQFLVKAADYYSVSCDYLLGHAANVLHSTGRWTSRTCRRTRSSAGRRSSGRTAPS